MSDRYVQARSFGRAASTYHAGRPGYPLEAVRWATPSGRRVVDLGAGTGNLTAALLALDRTTVAGVAAIAGSAEEIPLAGSSVDGVVAGQAAHWFDMHRAVPEMARVLRPGGSLGLIWNRIDPTSPWVIELVALLREANASRVGHGVDLSALPEGGFQRPVRQSWRFRQRLDRSVLIDLVASRSYVMRLDEKARSELLDSVEYLAPARDRFELPYICEVWRAFRRE